MFTIICPSDPGVADDWLAAVESFGYLTVGMQSRGMNVTKIPGASGRQNIHAVESAIFDNIIVSFSVTFLHKLHSFFPLR